VVQRAHDAIEAYWGDEVDVHQYREGTLSVDVFDARSHRAVWHGWATKKLSRADMDRSEGAKTGGSGKHGTARGTC
jgi:hypothetical protein